VIGPQVRITVDNSSLSANETTGAATADGLEIVAGFNDYRHGGVLRCEAPVSSNGGLTWSHVIVRPPAPDQTSVEGDPMTAYDRRTNTLWISAMAFSGNGGVYVASKNPGLNSFAPSVMARVSGGADKCWMEAGPRPGLPNTTRLYIAFNEGVVRSDDLGSTWSAPVSLGSGIGFLPRVVPNGELYITYWDFGTGIMFRRSLDGSQAFSAAVRAATRMDTWSTEFNNGRVPGDYRIPPVHAMDVNPVDGSITIVYFDTTNTIGPNRNLDLSMTRSTSLRNDVVGSRKAALPRSAAARRHVLSLDRTLHRRTIPPSELQRPIHRAERRWVGRVPGPRLRVQRRQRGQLAPVPVDPSFVLFSQ
jgi:hypothetical protein